MELGIVLPAWTGRLRDVAGHARVAEDAGFSAVIVTEAFHEYLCDRLSDFAVIVIKYLVQASCDATALRPALRIAGLTGQKAPTRHTAE